MGSTVNLLILGLDNATSLMILMGVLIAFILLLTVLGIVFIVALRKRRPVVKVIMAPAAQASIAGGGLTENADTPEAEAQAEPEPEPEDDDEESKIVTEGSESVRYNRSFEAKLHQLSNESKEWYTALKNELLSYEKVKERMSWPRESFRIGRVPVARLSVRGKTLCLFLCVEPMGYTGTKYTVEDVSNVANTVDTPTMYRIKSARRLKYAKEMIAGMMKEFKVFKDPRYEAQDFYRPYEGDMALMERGLIKRVVSGGTRTFRIEEVDEDEGDEE